MDGWFNLTKWQDVLAITIIGGVLVIAFVWVFTVVWKKLFKKIKQCIHTQKIKKAKVQYLKEENESLKEKVRLLEEENKSLKEENKSLKITNKSLEEDVEHYSKNQVDNNFYN